MLSTYYNRYKCFFKPLDILPNRPTLILTKTYVNFTDQIYSKISSITIYHLVFGKVNKITRSLQVSPRKIENLVSARGGQIKAGARKFFKKISGGGGGRLFMT